MKFTGSRGEKIAAFVFGGFLVVVQLMGFQKVPLPVNGEAIGYDVAWLVIFSAGAWLVLYGLGLVGRKKKDPSREHVP